MITMSPSEYLTELFGNLPITASQLAADMGVSDATVSRLMSGKMSVTASTALKLERCIGRSAESWLQMQNDYDLSRLRDGE